MTESLSRRAPRRFWGWGNADAALSPREQATVKGMLAALDAPLDDRPVPQVGEFTLPAPRNTSEPICMKSQPSTFATPPASTSTASKP